MKSGISAVTDRDPRRLTLHVHLSDRHPARRRRRLLLVVGRPPTPPPPPRPTVARHPRRPRRRTNPRPLLVDPPPLDPPGPRRHLLGPRHRLALHLAPPRPPAERRPHPPGILRRRSQRVAVRHRLAQDLPRTPTELVPWV